MRWRKPGLFQASMMVTSTALCLVLAIGIPLSMAHAQEVTVETATTSATMMPVTPTVDATVTVLNKEKLVHENW